MFRFALLMSLLAVLSLAPARGQNAASAAGAEPAGPEPQATTQFQTVPAPDVVAQPTAASDQNHAWNQLAKGRQLVRAGRPHEALAYIDEFIGQQPLEPEGYFWQGVALDNLGDLSRAQSAYTKAIEQVLKAGMDSAELRLNAGNVLLKQGNTAGAIEQYKRAARIDPGLGIVQLNLGRALLQSGDSAQALQCFARCKQLHFQPPQLDYYQAKALLAAGRTDEARAEVESALSKLAADQTDEAVAKKIKQEFAELLKRQTNAAVDAR